MDSETRRTDAKGRVSLPEGFANATVVIEVVSDAEVRIRKVNVVPEGEIRFLEESARPLSDRDRDLFLSLLENPPKANPALRRAWAKNKARHG